MAATDILRALQEAQMQPIESGYGMGANALGMIGGAAMSPRRSNSANLGIGVGSALLQGLLSGLARRDAATQNAGMYADFKRYQAGDESAVANNPRLQPLAMAMAAAKEEAAAKQAADLQKLELELQTKQKYETPFETKLSQAAALQDAKERVKAQYRPAKEGPDPTENYKHIDDLRKEVSGKDAFKSMDIVKRRMDVLKNAASDTSAISDYDYVYGVAKVLDENSVVRETEAGYVIDSASVPQQLLGSINKKLSGQRQFDTPLRNEMFNLVKRHYNALKVPVERELDRYEKLATKRGLPPEDILPYSKKYLDLGTDETARGSPDLQSLSDEQLDALIAAKSK